jgi:phenylacetate-CoA ligase
MSTLARLRFLFENQATVVCCTPTYALRMAEVAAAEKIDLRGSPVRALIVAGEPGGSIPETRRLIEAAWEARVFDHTGMTEIGPLGFECMEAPLGIHLSETECIAEVLDPVTHVPVEDGGRGELVITNLGRSDSPVIRYRTGDLVCPVRRLCACGRWFMRLEGGILGRLDDMFVVGGNNVFPSALEGIIRSFPEVAEFAIEVSRAGPMPRVVLKLEPVPEAAKDGLTERVGRAVQDRLSFRSEVVLVECGTLPRFELKARRYVKRD